MRNALGILVPLALALLAYHALLDNDAESAGKQGQVSVPPKVPADQLEGVKAMKNPAKTDAKSLEKGKELFMGKGTCASCHGPQGKGDGELSMNFNPPPRNFTGQKNAWQAARTDGEIYWVITNGTDQGMVPFAGMLSDEEIWSLVGYIRSLKNVK
jgi:mono/diheme cytochrome c family protein